MIVTFIHSHYPADDLRVQLRCRNFADAINRFGWHSANLLDLNSFIQGTLEAHQLCAKSDLLVIHRYLYGPVLEAIEYWKARDKKVIVDFDQAIDYLTPDMCGYSFWLEGKPFDCLDHENQLLTDQIDPIPFEQFKWGLGLVDAAIVPSARLVLDWSHFNDIYEIPDYLNTDQYPAFKQTHENEIWIGVANDTRIATMEGSGLLAALQAICQKRPQVKVALCNIHENPAKSILIKDSPISNDTQRVTRDWADLLLKLDIGLVPIHGDYDLRLGRISLLEFMISKTPWIASNQLAFRELSRYGMLIQNSSNAWELAILKVIDNIDVFRRRAAGEPFLFALSQDINENIDKVLKLFLSILNQTEGSGTR